MCTQTRYIEQESTTFEPFSQAYLTEFALI